MPVQKIMRFAEAIPPEPPSLARPMWRATSGEVRVASILNANRWPPSMGGFAQPATSSADDADYVDRDEITFGSTCTFRKLVWMFAHISLTASLLVPHLD
jgi:hypothetical protein